jgi:hypothetical protein
MELLAFFAIPALLTLPITAALCRFRIARSRRVSVGTLFAGACSTPLIAVAVGTWLDPGLWSTRNKGLGLGGVLMLIALLVVACALPAGLVVRYYQRREVYHERPKR